MASVRIVSRAGLARVGINDELNVLATPTYFPAVSSVCSIAPPESLVRLLADVGYPRALVSAFDCKRRMPGGVSAAAILMANLRKQGCTVILDSGMFECQVLEDAEWSYSDYEEVAAAVPHDIQLSFDGPIEAGAGRQRAPKGAGNTTTVRRPRRVWIAHGGDRRSIVDAVRKGLDSESAIGIAIPDREAGSDLAARIRTAGEVRRVTNETDETRLLHVLGCGNPVVMAAYTLAGVDSFDSLDWTQGALDIRTLTFTDPLLLKHTGCKCKVCTELPGPAGQLALLHNLLFYQRFVAQLREMAGSGTLLDFIQACAGKECAARLAEELRPLVNK